jgi:type III secretion protein T
VDVSLFSSPGFAQFLRELLQPLLALGLAAARPLGMALVFPLLTRAELGGLLRAALALALGLPLVWSSTVTVAALGQGASVSLTLLVLKEALVGAFLGYLMGLPFWAIQSVGELLDTQRGVGNELAGPTDPTTRAQGSVLSLLLGIAALALFVAGGGLETFVRTLYGSYEAWPQASFAPKFSLDSALLAVAGLADILRYAFLVAGPIVVLLLLIDLAVMLIGRSAPNLNANDLAPTIKNVVFLIAIGLYATYLVAYMRAELSTLVGLGERLPEFTR